MEHRFLVALALVGGLAAFYSASRESEVGVSLKRDRPE